MGGIILGLVIMAVISAFEPRFWLTTDRCSKGAKMSGAAAFDNELRTLG